MSKKRWPEYQVQINTRINKWAAKTENIPPEIMEDLETFNKQYDETEKLKIGKGYVNQSDDYKKAYEYLVCFEMILLEYIAQDYLDTLNIIASESERPFPGNVRKIIYRYTGIKQSIRHLKKWIRHLEKKNTTCINEDIYNK